MKKLAAGLILGAGLVTLAACGAEEGASTEGESKTLTVGASNVPHAEILEQVKPILEEQGIELEIETYQDYVLPNQDLDSGDLDANYFQHIPYLESQIAEFDYDFVNAGGIHIEPIGLYSKKFGSIDELPEGATILMSNSVADHGRVLSMLERAGLIKLDESVEKTVATIEDVVENPKNIEFDPNYEAALLVQMYEQEEGDAVLINSNYALDAGLNPIEDSIAIEDSNSPYVNVIAVNAGDEENEAIKALVDALRSDEIQNFILEEWGGSVVPVTE